MRTCRPWEALDYIYGDDSTKVDDAHSKQHYLEHQPQQEVIAIEESRLSIDRLLADDAGIYHDGTLDPFLCREQSIQGPVKLWLIAAHPRRPWLLCPPYLPLDHKFAACLITVITQSWWDARALSCCWHPLTTHTAVDSN